MTAKDHYAFHLAHFYSWMIGDFGEKQKSEEDFFIRNGIPPTLSKLAIDLGAGNGLQSVSLARLGFEVIAFDFNTQLLDELTSNTKDLNITTVCDDVIKFWMISMEVRTRLYAWVIPSPILKLTIILEKLVEKISERLVIGGKLVISFRELLTEVKAKKGLFPSEVIQPEILTCFLEYFPKPCYVHDILHELQAGKWIQTVSSYPKLRLSHGGVTAILERNDIKFYLQKDWVA
jgi:SAM-dependent methyltransferase